MDNVIAFSPLQVVLIILGVFGAAFVVTFIVIMLIRGLGQWRQGNAPRVALDAVVTGKRRETYQRKGNVSETYYVTFEADDGEQTEVVVDAATYGLLATGDSGQLTLRGLQYLAFVRNEQEGAYDREQTGDSP